MPAVIPQPQPDVASILSALLEDEEYVVVTPSERTEFIQLRGPEPERDNDDHSGWVYALTELDATLPRSWGVGPSGTKTYTRCTVVWWTNLDGVAGHATLLDCDAIPLRSWDVSE